MHRVYTPQYFIRLFCNLMYASCERQSSSSRTSFWQGTHIHSRSRGN